MDWLVILAAILGGISIILAIVFWKKILKWAEESIFPWIKENFPQIEPYVRTAFSALDKVAVPIRVAVKQAWEELRKVLLKQVVELEKRLDDTWLNRVTSFIIRELESSSSEPVVVKMETETIMEWDDLPEDVREEYLRLQKNKTDINVTDLRDQEIDGMDLSN